jgi:NTE family protein
MDDDLLEDTAVARADLGLRLAAVSVFADLEPLALEAIAADVEWFSLPGGAMLFDVGESADALYVVLSGCLGAFASDDPLRPRLLGRIVAGDTAGEMGLITGRARTARVIALRDSELVRLSSEAFNRIFLSLPQAMLRMARLTAERLESSHDPTPGRPPGPRTFAILPQSLEADVTGFATELVRALRRLGQAELVWSVRGADHTSQWFHRIESANDYVVYVADQAATPWSRLCMRQADVLLLVARAESVAAPWPALEGLPNASVALQRSELVLLHDERIERGAATRWLALQPHVPHHHVVRSADVARVARLLTGTAVGLVLSGGGARGFAHIGVVQALRELGIAIDLVGGTSMGGIMGAAVASGWSVPEMVERFRRSFVLTNPLRDYTVPWVSLVSGRKVSRLLYAGFGDDTIEDLALPFFCVSSSLTSGYPAVHRSGVLWRWLRASVAIPGVLPPVLAQGEVFVDGGATNNLPVDVMRDLGRGPIIACDVGADRAFTARSEDVDAPPLWKLFEWMRGARRRPNIFQILFRAGMVGSAALTYLHREQSDLLLQPPLETVDMLNWKAFDKAVAAGHDHAIDRIGALGPAVAMRFGLRGEGFG